MKMATVKQPKSDLILSQSSINGITENVAEMMKVMFEKHKQVARSHRQLEIENKLLKEKISDLQAKELDSNVNRSLENELNITKSQLKDAEGKVARLSVEVQKLKKEVNVWFEKSLRREIPVLPNKDGTFPPLDQSSSSRSSQSPSKNSIRRSDVDKSTDNAGNLSKSNSPDSSGASAASTALQIITLSDSDSESENKQNDSSRSSLEKSDFKSGKPEVKVRPADGTKKKRFRTPSPEPYIPDRPLQTNTCKVCESYWRAEDARKPGEMKKNDLPWCRIHGRRRPPCTPENYWKVHLSPPRVV